MFSACEPESLRPVEYQEDVFILESTFPLDKPGRALAVARANGVTAALVAREFSSDVQVIAIDGTTWTDLSSAAVPEGPRAVCAAGDAVFVASTADASVSSFRFDGLRLRPSWSSQFASPPTSIACADFDGDGMVDAFVSAGLAEEATAGILDGATSAFEALPAAHVSDVRVGDMDADGDPDALAVSTTHSTLQILRNENGGLEVLHALTLDCKSPRAATVFRTVEGSTSFAVACDGAVVIVERPLSTAPGVAIVDAPARLYDIASLADSSVPAGLSVVSIESHELLVAPPSLEGWTPYGLARGPVAIAVVDVQPDNYPDLIVLSLEQRRLSLFVNQRGNAP